MIRVIRSLSGYKTEWVPLNYCEWFFDSLFLFFQIPFAKKRKDKEMK